MDPEEKSLSPQEGFELIVSAISKTKEGFKENSAYFMLWGWLIAIASFSFFALQQFTAFRYYFLPFPVLAAAGIITTLAWYSKRRSVSKTETYLGYFFGRLWLVLGISFIVVVFVSVSQKLPPFVYTAVIAGIGTLVSGLAMKFRPLIIGGILFFCSAIVCVYIPDNYKSLFFGAAITWGYLLPGYLLKLSDL